MKKLLYLFGAMALMAGMVACGPDEGGQEGPSFDVVEAGYYVGGDAVGADASLTPKYRMTTGINEKGNVERASMHEKYIYLNPGKLEITKYDGEEVKCGSAFEQPLEPNGDDYQVYCTVPFGKLVSEGEIPEMTITEAGLYHIVIDDNVDGAFESPVMALTKVNWGINAIMDLDSEETVNEDGSVTYTIEGYDIAWAGKFKFSYGYGWKVKLVGDNIHYNTNLGVDMVPGATDIPVVKGGTYTIKLTWKLAEGAVKNSFSYEMICTEEAPKPAYPTELYIIGNDFGNWDWASDGVVTMNPVHSHPGHFWAVRYMTTDTQFKFCSVKEWKGDFTGLADNYGFIVPDNCQVEADGLYIIYYNYDDYQIVIEPATIYGFGEAFGGWDTPVALTLNTEGESPVVVGSVVANANTEDQGLRLYAGLPKYYAETWAVGDKKVDWWQMEFTVVDGKIAYRGAGDDQRPRTHVTAGQTVTLDFNAGTGTIQ